jgi:hypothetical protein
MRRRPHPIPIPILLLVLLASLTLARPAAAQHCWPSSVALLVRDEAGALIHPRELNGYTYTPERPDSSDQGFRVRRLTGDRWGPLAPEGTHALYWWGRGDCRVQLDEVVLRRGDGVMRLRLNLRLNTGADPGPTEYVIDSPPFQAGTWELALPLPPGRTGAAAVVTADRWRRLPDGGQ